LFAFSCPCCKKEHHVSESFTAPYYTVCFRCRASFLVTKEHIWTIPAVKMRRKWIVNAPPPSPAASSPEVKKQPSRRGWLVIGLVTTSVLSLAGGGIFLFGGGDSEKQALEEKVAAPRESKKSFSSFVSAKVPVAEQAGVGKPIAGTDSAPLGSNAGKRSRSPLEVVQEAIARKFGKKVIVTGVRIEDGKLTLEGELHRWEDLRPAREIAIQALEEAGLGPIKDWENHLKKPKKER
jgi:hypothetical protein